MEEIRIYMESGKELGCEMGIQILAGCVIKNKVTDFFRKWIHLLRYGENLYI